MTYTEREVFKEWRKDVLRIGYRGLCEQEESNCQWNRIKKDYLYEFCAMNGHLAAFEEVFER